MVVLIVTVCGEWLESGDETNVIPASPEKVDSLSQC